MGLHFTMVKMSILSECLKKLTNAEKAGKRQVLLRPMSKVVVKFLRQMQKNGYINKFEKFVYNILPSRQFGHVVLTTNKGIMDHKEARANHTGGKVLGYFY